MNAFEELERRLRKAVADRAAMEGRPSPGGEASRRSRLRHRTGLLALAGAIVLGGGAVAAQQLRIGDPVGDPGVPRPDPHQGPGITAKRSVRVLPLRVRDPAGGPPWALRIFTTNRGGSCVQPGQVYKERFGLVRPADKPPYREVFRPLPAEGGGHAMCSGATMGGFPVVRGWRQVVVRRGQGSAERCSGDPCPVRDVRIVRYGLLGPEARSATYRDEHGVERARMTLAPTTGGAYLFVVATDPAPYRAQDEFQRAWSDAADKARRRGLKAPDAMREAQRRTRGLRPSRNAYRARDAVDATFAGGRTMRVAGHGREHGRLPGVRRRAAPSPSSVRATVAADRRVIGRADKVTISFRSPIAVRRFDAGFRQRLAGPWRPPVCRKHDFGRAFNAYNRDIAEGERVSFTLKPSGDRWCPGSYAARITYKAGGVKRELLVGTARFEVR